MVNLPEITKKFRESIAQKAQEGTYKIVINGISIDVFPYVFPPQSTFSESTHTVYDEFGNLKNKGVLDIGTGTGIQAIQAALAGAEYVDAVDILPESVTCASHNIQINGLEHKIKVYQSDMFSNVPKKKYDLIIANLPILEFPETDLRFHSLSDPDFRYHDILFRSAGDYLSNDGKIVLCHADLQECGFEKLEKLALEKGFKYRITKSTKSLGYEWRNYEFFKEDEK